MCIQEILHTFCKQNKPCIYACMHGILKIFLYLFEMYLLKIFLHEETNREISDTFELVPNFL